VGGERAREEGGEGLTEDDLVVLEDDCDEDDDGGA
jgi:hypothetical protein